jgi:hypothetical protein
MTMYEMYPDSWTDAQASRYQRGSSDQPRRRARKEHSVVPAVLVQRLDGGRSAQADSA